MNGRIVRPTTWKRVHPKCFMSEMTDLETLDVDGIVRANVGYSCRFDTVESRHFYRKQEIRAIAHETRLVHVLD